jgi:preprotein translocase subunit SecE
MAKLDATTGNDVEQNEQQRQRRTGVAAFFRETIHELKRVRWPRRKEVVNYTAAALITCLVMGLLVWVFDIGVHAAVGLLGIHE